MKELRDELAGRAMQAIIGMKDSTDPNVRNLMIDCNWKNAKHFTAIAACSYMLADAMIKVRDMPKDDIEQMIRWQ